MDFTEQTAVLIKYGLYALAFAVLWVGINPIARWKFRHIPGPFGMPFLGNLPAIMVEYQHNYFLRNRDKYGPVYKIWWGPIPSIVVCDADAIRKVAYKCNNRYDLPHTFLGRPKYNMDNSLLLLRADTWRLVKKAWDPATMHRNSLEGYAPLMQVCADQLVERLKEVEGGEPVDIWVRMSRMTMQAVGSCAFGIHFGQTDGLANADASKPDDDGWREVGRKLVQSCSDFFRSQELENASKWVIPVLCMPPFANFFRFLAYLLPDQGHKQAVESQVVMTEIAQKIIDASREQRQRDEGSGQTDGGADGASKEVANGEGAPGKAARGVLPGSFVAQLEKWADKHRGQVDVDDKLLVAQVITFLLGGYETTASAMSFLVYLLSINPEAQKKLTEELDTVLGDSKPTLDDLPQLVYLDACIKEALRLMAPGVVLLRRNELPEGGLDMMGYNIPKGAHMLLFNYGSHYDPRYWERVPEFVPERFLPEAGGKLGPFNENAYMPFGSGGRMCVGYKFALQEMQMVVASLFQHFTFTRPAGEPPLRTKVGLTLAPIGAINVLVHGRGK